MNWKNVLAHSLIITSAVASIYWIHFIWLIAAVLFLIGIPSVVTIIITALTYFFDKTMFIKNIRSMPNEVKQDLLSFELSTDKIAGAAIYLLTAILLFVFTGFSWSFYAVFAFWALIIFVQFSLVLIKKAAMPYFMEM